MEDAKTATEAVIRTVDDACNRGDVDGYVDAFHEKFVMLPEEHGVVLKSKTELHDYVAAKLPLLSKVSLQETLDFQMLGDDYAVGCYHFEAYDNQEAVFKHFTDLIVWRKVAGAWRILSVMYATLK